MLKATPASGKGRYMVLTVFFIEHLLFLMIYFIKKYLESKKEWPEIYL